MFKQNIGVINAIVRITCGFTLFAWALSKMVRRPYDTMPLFTVIMGAMKIAEGITRFCPLTYLFEEKVMHFDDEEYDDYDISPVNPS
ncbi:YgaP family membrane protein [Evansella halocellulosilytica]|uniref:YgaP family membrane protein n=1 Tax=Evansella halocellulosilytica TaxID=2011013 RepID=UPI000BB73FFE|nr:DUF2892 domain-containing protein [Evansella halocellulosilytica]